jgi:hypothetical protein
MLLKVHVLGRAVLLVSFVGWGGYRSRAARFRLQSRTTLAWSLIVFC